MCIYLGGRNALMPKHFLNYAQVCSPFYQVGGKGVSECVWRYALGHSGSESLLLYHLEE